MPVRYKRKYRLELGLASQWQKDTLTFLRSETDFNKVTPFNLVDASNGYGGTLIKREDGSNGTFAIPSVVIEDLHIEATIKAVKSPQGSGSDPTEIHIYNLSEQYRQKLSKGNSITLFAGYTTDAELPLVYTGEVAKVFTKKKGPDYITTIYCKDSDAVRKYVRVTKTYPDGITYRGVLKDLAKITGEYGLPIGQFNTLFQNSAGAPDPLAKPIPGGYSVFGFALDELSKICKEVGYTSYVFNGRLYIEPLTAEVKDQAGNLRQAKVTPSRQSYFLDINLLSGYVEKMSEYKAGTDNSSDTNDGIVIKTFLDGNASIAKNLVLSSKGTYGQYEIVEVKHLLSYEGNDWDTEITAKAITDVTADGNIFAGEITGGE